MKVNEGTQRIHTTELKGRKIQLSIVEGMDRGNQYEITKPLTTIGRAKRNDIVLGDKRVSANHAAIEIQNGEVIVRDLGSTNGTFVNNQKITTLRLQNLDELVMGTTKLLISIFDDLNHFKKERTGRTLPPQHQTDLLHDESMSQSSQIMSDIPLSVPSAADPEQSPPSPKDGESQSFLEINHMISEEIKGISALPAHAQPVSKKSEPERTAALSHIACTLRLLRGPDSPKDFTLKKATTTVGRKECDLKLNDIDVSRKHLSLEIVPPDKLFIRDLGSTNGTFVNGKRVSYQQLHDKDLVQCGQTLIEISLEDIEPS